MKMFLSKGNPSKRLAATAKALLFCFLAGLAVTANAQARMSLGDDFGALIDTDETGAGVMYLWGAILGEGAGAIEPVAMSMRWRDVSVSQVPAADAHFLAIAEDGTLWAWGNNDRGQLGVGDQLDRADPVQISMDTNWVEVAAGKWHSLARKSDGRLYVWGDNTYGQLNFASSGNSTIDLRDTFPTSPIDSNSYRAISAGAAHSHAIRTDGTLWTWGSALAFAPRAGPELGILIDGSFPRVEVVPMVQVDAGAGWTDLFGGQSVTFATRDSGSEVGQLWVWGRGGQLGLDLTITQETPIRVGSLTGWSNVSVSSTNGTIGHTLAIQNGDLYAWGAIYNTYVPTLLSPAVGTGTWEAIGAGAGFSAIFDSNNDLFTIGANDVGQLVNGTTGTGRNSFEDTLFGEGTFDLVAVSVERTSTGTIFGSGDPLAFDIRISNLGSGALTFPAISGVGFVSARLVPIDGSADTTSAVLSGVSSVPDGTIIPAYGETTLSFSGTIPAGVSVGQYSLEVDIDAGGVVDEFSESNNTVASIVDEASPAINFTVDLRPMASALSVTKITNTGTSGYEVGDRFSVGYTIENLGTGVIKAVEQPAHRLKFVLTPNADVVAGDNVIELVPVGADSNLNVDQDIGAEGLSPYSAATDPDDANPLEFEVPNGVEAINYHLAMVVDSTNAFEESNEDNNTAFTATKLIQIEPVDLWEALDLPADDPSLETTGDADWFGFFAPDAPGTANNDAAFSPQLDASEQSSIRLNVGPDASIVRFSWRASTSGGSNFLQFNAGAQVLTLSGETGWITESVAVPANTEVTWTYFAGSGGAGEQVFLDAVSVSAISGPDVIVPQAFLLDASYSPITTESVTVIAGDDSSLILAYELRNQGEALAAGGSLKIKAFLSRDTILDPLEDEQVDLDINDPLSMEVVYDRGGQGMPSGLSDSLIHQVGLPVGLFGDYFLIIQVSDVSGETELAVIENNTYVMESPIVTVEALPDLAVEPESINRNVFFLGNSVLVDYKLKNFGFGDAFGLVQLRLVFSEDRDYDEATDFTIGQGIYFGGIAAGGPLFPTVAQNSFSLFSIPSTVPIGDFRYIGLVVDPANTFAESNESNNAAFFENPEYAFGNLSLEVALDQVDSPVSYSINANFDAPFSTGFPFFGQTVESNDGIDAARSAVIGDGEKSFFEIEVTVPTGTDYILNFDWKVSSEEKDRFFLYRDGVAQKNISGEVNWTEEFLLLPGEESSEKTYKLRWSYEKDSSLSSGDDFGWVDRLSISELTLPDLRPDLVSITDNGEIVDSATFEIARDSLSLNYTLQNIGADHIASNDGELKLGFYLSEDAAWDEDDPELETIASAPLGSINLGSGHRISGSLTVFLDPAKFSEGNYYLIAYADPPDPTTNVVESNETNNIVISESRIIQLDALPDLTLDFDSTASLTGGVFLITDPLGEVSLDLVNLGAGGVSDPFTVSLQLSDVNGVLPTSLLRNYTEPGPLSGAGGDQDTINFARNLSAIGTGVELGRVFELTVEVDSEDVIAEFDESNNQTLTGEGLVLLFADLSLWEALSPELLNPDAPYEQLGATESLTLRSDQTAPFEAAYPFVGLTGESSIENDSGAARSVALGRAQASEFTIELMLEKDTKLAFLWKADAGGTESDTSLHGTFEVSVDGQPVDGLSLTTGSDWSEEIIEISASSDSGQPVSVTWRFEKDDTESAALANTFAFVDGVRLLPDLEIELNEPGSLSLAPKDPISFSATVKNTNLGSVPEGVEYGITARLSTNKFWSSTDGDIEWKLDGNPGAVAANGSIALDFETTIPEQTPPGDYYLLLRVDPSPELSSTAENGEGLILEVDETNNDAGTATVVINISASSIEEALDIDPIGFEDEFNRAVFPTVSAAKKAQTSDLSWSSSPDIEVKDRLDGIWFAASGVNTGADGGDTDAIKTSVLPAGAAASLLFRLDEPRLVSFRVKANTSGSGNYMFFGANGNELRPEGNLPSRFFGTPSDWQEVYYIVPDEAPVGFTYVQGTTPETEAPFDDGEFVYVDKLVVGAELDKPDYLINTLQYEAGGYVLQRDRLFVTVTGNNRGLTATEGLPSDFKVRVWLAPTLERDLGEAGDLSDDRFLTDNFILLGDLDKFQDLDAASRFAYQASLPLPENIPEGNYYLVARVDAGNDVDEFAVDIADGSIDGPEPAAFFDADNNFLISPENDIFIDRRADLRILPSEDSVFNELLVAGPAEQSVDDVVDVFIIEPSSFVPARDPDIADQSRSFGQPISVVSDVDASLDQTYLILNDTSGTVGVWLNVSGLGTSPIPADTVDRELEVSILSNASAEDVTMALEQAIDADASFHAKAAGSYLAIRSAAPLAVNVVESLGNTGFADVSTSVVVAREDSGGSLDGAYFILNDPDGNVGVWINIDASESQLAPGALSQVGREIEIDTIASNASAEDVALAIRTALAEDIEFNASLGGSVVTIQRILDDYAEPPSELLLKFDLLNEGLSGVSAADADDFMIDVYAATSREQELADQLLISSFIVEEGIAAGTRYTFEETTAIPDTIPAGSFYYISVVVDAGNSIPESDEVDNITFSPHRNVFVGDVSLEVALNDGKFWNEAEKMPFHIWDKSFRVPTRTDSTQQAPFFGTRQVFGQDNSDTGVRASARSGPVPAGGESWMQKTVSVTEGSEVQVSFLWKVSSQFVVVNGVVLEDILQFSIRYEGEDQFEQIAKISGEQDWAEYIFTISQSGTHTVRWSYIENGDNGRAGSDAGWVDNYSESSYDFVPTFLPPSSGTVYAAGAEVSLPVFIWNMGDLRIPDSGIMTTIRLTGELGDVSNLDWSVPSSGDVTLQTTNYNQLNPSDLIYLRDNFSNFQRPKRNGEQAQEMPISDFDAIMDGAIRALLSAEESEVEPELTKEPNGGEIRELREVLDSGTWRDYNDEQIQLLLGARENEAEHGARENEAEHGARENEAEQASRRRFLPVRTYEPELSDPIDANSSRLDSNTIKIPNLLSEAGNYYIGVWTNVEVQVPESNFSNNLLFTEERPVELQVDYTIPEVLEQSGDQDNNPDLLDGVPAWSLSGQGRWYPVADPAAENRTSLRSPGEAMAQDGEASVSALVEGPKLIRFRWRPELDGSSDVATFYVNNLPVSRDYEGPSASTMSLSSGDDAAKWIEEQYFLPAGLNEVRWTYKRFDDDLNQGAVYLDNIRIEDITDRVDLSITSVEYTGGTYALERDLFPLRVIVENRGSRTGDFDYTDLDLEVRLGLTQIFEDAIPIIGNFAVVDALDQGQRLVFEGEVDLPINLDEGSYYLLVRVKSLDLNFQEFTYLEEKNGPQELLGNNDYASGAQDVSIEHLPQLVVRTTYVENEKVFYPKESIRFDWVLENVGLGDIPYGTSLTQTVELWSVGVDEPVPSLANGEKVLDIGLVTEQTYLAGRLTAESREQSTIAYKEIFRLPSQAEMLSAIGAVPAGLEDLDAEVIANLGELENFKFFLVLIRDNMVEQSSALNVNAFTGELFRISAFPYDAPNPSDGMDDPAFDFDATLDFQLWSRFSSDRLGDTGALTPSGNWDDSLSGGGFENLYYYAFNLPLVADLSVASPRVERDTKGETGYYLTRTIELEPSNRKIETTLGQHTDVDVVGGLYRAITFPVVRGATDLIYRVQTRPDGASSWEDHLDIEPPYLDSLYGRTGGYIGGRSLNEVNESTNSISLMEKDEKIVSVVDNNYTATVTVRATRLNRIRVDNGVELKSWMTDNNLYTEYQLSEFDSLDTSNTDLMDSLFYLLDVLDTGTLHGDVDGDLDGDGEITRLGLTDTDGLVSWLENNSLSSEYQWSEFDGLDPFLGPQTIASLIRVLDALEDEEIRVVVIPQGLPSADQLAIDVFTSALGIYDYRRVSLLSDYDSDDLSNIAELQLGYEVTDSASPSVAPTPLQVFVAEQMALLGVLPTLESDNSLTLPANIAPGDDWDNDGFENQTELLAGSDPTDPDSEPQASSVNLLVAQGWLDLGTFNTEGPVANFLAYEDFDGDGINNIVEFALASRDPGLGGDVVSPSDLELFIASVFTDPVAEGIIPDRVGEGYGLFGNPLSAIEPESDYDGDGTSNIAEILLARIPTSGSDAGASTFAEDFTAEGMAGAGVFVESRFVNDVEVFEIVSRDDIQPNGNYDGDLVINILELMLGSDPTDFSSQVPINSIEYFVAESLASSAAFDNYPVVNYAPFDDLDEDGTSNIVELLLLPTLPTGASEPSIEPSSLLDVYAAEGLANLGRFGTQGNYEALDDFDGDGSSNIAELQLGRDPSTSADVGSTTELEDSVAESFAVDYGIYSSAIANDISPFGDYDSDGVSNTVEIDAGTDPTDPLDFPSGSVEASILDVFADAGVSVGVMFAGQIVEAADLAPNGDLDRDGKSNLLEYALGGSLTDSSVQPEPLSPMVDGTDFVLTFIRLKSSETPDDLEIILQRSETLDGIYAAVPPVDLTEGVSSDQSGLPSNSYERVEMRVDTNSMTYGFFNVLVQQTL